MTAAAPIGLIAGNGRFPLLFARAARELGRPTVAVALEGETDPALAEVVTEIVWVRVGELGRLIEALKQRGVAEAVMAGGVRKARMFTDARPDLRAFKLLARVKLRKDDSLLRALADELAEEGIAVRPSTIFLADLITPKGVLAGPKPSAAENEDIQYGWELAQEIGRLDIGQCVVVKDRTVLAVEAIEGTDETIRRGGRFGRSGAVVVKVSKPQQDLRFDLPCAGPDTIAAMLEAGARLLALESGASLLLEKDLLLRNADQAGITVVGL
jgi:DUF1009 family protein